MIRIPAPHAKLLRCGAENLFVHGSCALRAWVLLFWKQNGDGAVWMESAYPFFRGSFKPASPRIIHPHPVSTRFFPAPASPYPYAVGAPACSAGHPRPETAGGAPSELQPPFLSHVFLYSSTYPGTPVSQSRQIVHDLPLVFLWVAINKVE